MENKTTGTNSIPAEDQIQRIKQEQDHETKMKLGQRMIEVIMERYKEPYNVALELVGRALDDYQEMADLEDIIIKEEKK